MGNFILALKEIFQECFQIWKLGQIFIWYKGKFPTKFWLMRLHMHICFIRSTKQRQQQCNFSIFTQPPSQPACVRGFLLSWFDLSTVHPSQRELPGKPRCHKALSTRWPNDQIGQTEVSCEFSWRKVLNSEKDKKMRYMPARASADLIYRPCHVALSQVPAPNYLPLLISPICNLNCYRPLCLVRRPCPCGGWGGRLWSWGSATAANLWI